MSRKSLFRRFRKRVRAMTFGKWVLMLLVFNGINYALEQHQQKISVYDLELKYQTTWQCQDRANKKLGYNKRHSFSKVSGFEPTQKHDNFWSYSAGIKDQGGQRIGFLRCTWYDPVLDIDARLVKGSEPSIEIFDYRGAKRITYSNKQSSL